MHSHDSRVTAVVFPGQGSQKQGMAQDFYQRFAVSRDVFAEASEALGLDMPGLCFGDDPRLDLTEYTQPAILTAEIAMLRALERDFGLRATYWGGHSLGEYTALCAAGVLPLPVAARLVRRRGVLMQQAVPAGSGSMVAVIARAPATWDLADELADLEVDVANRNSPDQVVLSGAGLALEHACARVEKLLRGVEHQLVPLQVSAPFHSRAMLTVEAKFGEALEAASPHMRPERASVVTSNLTGRFHLPELAPMLDALRRQIRGTVDWIANMRSLSEAATEIVEVGPHRPLRGFFKSIGRDVMSIVSVRTAEKGLAA
jgi:[acyl-carrier-protein] S-malonyltransferase/trans-AT polyketide synthase/acyltransferase/oxidoreductase domain-containing protein